MVSTLPLGTALWGWPWDVLLLLLVNLELLLSTLLLSSGKDSAWVEMLRVWPTRRSGQVGRSPGGLQALSRLQAAVAKLPPSVVLRHVCLTWQALLLLFWDVSMGAEPLGIKMHNSRLQSLNTVSDKCRSQCELWAPSTTSQGGWESYEYRMSQGKAVITTHHPL